MPALPGRRNSLMTQYNNESIITKNRKSGRKRLGNRLAGTARKRLAGGLRRVLTAALLLLALLFQAGCGEKLDTGFRVLEVIGTRRYSVICRKDDRIAPMIDEAMQHLAYTGHLGSLCVRWLGRDQITLAGHPPSAQTTQEPGGGTQEQRTLIVGLETDFFPMAYTSDSGLSGLTVDIANALGTELGWEVRIRKHRLRPGLRPFLRQGGGLFRRRQLSGQRYRAGGAPGERDHPGQGYPGGTYRHRGRSFRHESGTGQREHFQVRLRGHGLPVLPALCQRHG